MSFGWSASDLAQAIGLIVKIVKALDEADGAAADYREAVKFLRSLKHTLEPLQTFAALDPYTEYRDEIRQHVEEIRVPIENFLVLVSKFESSLGSGATAGRLRNINRKLQWRFHTSDKVITLRRHIESHMVILGTLLARLTLETVLSIHKRSPSTTIINPPLLDLLKEHVLPIRERVVTVSKTLETQHQSILSNLEKQHTLIQESCNERARSAQEAGQQNENILFKFEEQHTLTQRSRDELSLSEKETRRQHESFLSNLERQNVLHQKNFDKLSTHTQKADQQQARVLSELEKQGPSLEDAVNAIKAHITSAVESLPSGSTMKTPGTSNLKANLGDMDEALVTLRNAAAIDEKKESLRELYYLVLLHLGSFLRDALLLLCRKIKPPPALVPRLLAKYHISFSDALGRVRVLDYDCFANLEMFRSFIQTSFTGVAGESWIKLGLYSLQRAGDGSVLTPKTWSQLVTRGTYVNMSMIVDRAGTARSIAKDSCPIPTCDGVLMNLETKYLDRGIGNPSNSARRYCSICKIEVGETQSSTSVKPATEPATSTARIALARNSYQDDISTDDSDGGQDSARHVKRTKSRTKSLKARQKSYSQLIVSQDILNFKRIALRGSFYDLFKGSKHPSFLFCLDEVKANEDPYDGGVEPSFNLDGYWLPPTESAGLDRQRLGHLYRWHNGVIRKVTNYKRAKKGWQDSARSQLIFHKCVTIFYANLFDHFRVAQGDATSYNMATADFPYNRWWPLTFYNNEKHALSMVDIAADNLLLVGRGTNVTEQLGLSPYGNQKVHAPLATGLAGNLAILVGLVAFSCKNIKLDTILTHNGGAWRDRRWRNHAWPHGRDPERGMVVSVYFDPENPEESNVDSLYELEFGGDASL